MTTGTSVQEYLEVLYKLTQGGKKTACTSDVSDMLGVSAASASQMIRRMADQGLVDRVPYRGATLTAKGRLEGARVIRYHRLWERFLVDMLGMDWDEVHDEACRLEHATSPGVARHLAAFLDDPATCPHGHTVPHLNNTHGADNRPAEGEPATMPLSEAPDGFVGEVAALEEDADLLRHCAEVGLVPGARFRVLEGPGIDEVLKISVTHLPPGARRSPRTKPTAEATEIVVGPGVGRRVRVAAVPGTDDRVEVYA